MGCFGYICKGCGTPIIGKSSDDGGESCIMYHVRHGEVLGSVEGHYNEYGGVVEQENLPEYEKFRGEEDAGHHNSHYEIHKSEFGLEDSYAILCNLRIHNGVRCTFLKYMISRVLDDLRTVDYHISKLPYYRIYHKYATINPSMLELHKQYMNYLSEYKRGDVSRRLLNISNLEFTARILFESMAHVFMKMEDKYFMKEFNELPRIECKAYSGVVAYHSVCYRKAMRDGTFNLIPSVQDDNQSWGTVRKKYKDGGNYDRYK